MNEILHLLPALVGGVALGILFFGGLWWTVQKGVHSERPAFWFFTSFLLRTSMALTGLYYISAGDWPRLLVCLLGCIIGRLIVMRLSRLEKSGNTAQGVGHASESR
jgi:F1F0 ATPase subunit 2